MCDLVSTSPCRASADVGFRSLILPQVCSAVGDKQHVFRFAVNISLEKCMKNVPELKYYMNKGRTVDHNIAKHHLSQTIGMGLCWNVMIILAK